MEILFPISVVMLVTVVLVALGLIVKLIFDTVTKMTDKAMNVSDSKTQVFILKVTPDGEVKVRKYRGSVNYLDGKSWSDTK